MKYKGNVTGSCEGSNFTEFPINNPQFRIKKKKKDLEFIPDQYRIFLKHTAILFSMYLMV